MMAYFLQFLLIFGVLWLIRVLNAYLFMVNGLVAPDEWLFTLQRAAAVVMIKGFSK